MLKYREFPVRTSVMYSLFAPTLAYMIYTISRLIDGIRDGVGYLYPALEYNNLQLLGLGAIAATLAIPLFGIISDRVNKQIGLTFLFSFIPLFLDLIQSFIGYPNDFTPNLEIAWIMLVFAGLAIIMITLTIQMNKSIVIRYRGSSVALLLSVCLILVGVYRHLQSVGLIIEITGLSLPLLLALFALFASAALKPWKVHQVPLAVSGNHMRYFLPMVCLMGAHMLWYFSTKVMINKDYDSFTTMFEYSIYLNPNWQFIPLIIGIVFAGVIADRMGRKTGFSISVLLVGVLTIFGEAGYGFSDSLTMIVLAIVERFVEGFLLGMCLMLIWSELGSPKTKGRRLAMVWFFFLGYMTLFWLVDFEGFGLGVPSNDTFRNLMGPSAVLLTLLAQYWSAHLPTMLGREMEMEDLEISISDKEVKKTVDAYLGDEDFESIRSQVDIIDATEDVSDDELKEMLGDDYDQFSSLQSIPGIGPNLEKKLSRAGYKTPAQLAGETAKRLASKIDGLSSKRAAKILEETRKRVKKTIRKKKKNQS